MVLGNDEHKRFFPKVFHLDVGIGNGAGDNREIQLALEHLSHQGCLKIFPYIDLKIRESLSAPGDELGEKERRQGGAGPDGDLALHGRVVFKLFGGSFHLKEDAPGALKEDDARFREDSLAAHPVKKLVSKLALKLYYLLTKRWLSYV